MKFGAELKLKKDWKYNEYITIKKGSILKVAEYEHKYGMKLYCKNISLLDFKFDWQTRDERIDEYFEEVKGEIKPKELMSKSFKENVKDSATYTLYKIDSVYMLQVEVPGRNGDKDVKDNEIFFNNEEIAVKKYNEFITAHENKNKIVDAKQIQIKKGLKELEEIAKDYYFSETLSRDVTSLIKISYSKNDKKIYVDDGYNCVRNEFYGDTFEEAKNKAKRYYKKG